MASTSSENNSFTKIKNILSCLIRSFWEFLKETSVLFAENYGTIAAFSILSALAALAVVSLCTTYLFKLLSVVENVAYIDSSNLLSVITKPWSIIILLLYLISMTFVALFEIAGLLHAFSMAQIGRKTDILSMFRAGWRICKKTLNPVNWLMLIFLLVLFPLTKVIVLSNSSFKISIPSFIMQAIHANALYNGLFTIVYLIMLIVVLALLFTINVYVLTDKNFFASCKQAWNIGKRNAIKTILYLLTLNLLVTVLINSATSIIIVNGFDLLSHIFGKASDIVSSGNLGTSLNIFKHLVSVITLPAINNAGFTVLFFRYVEEDEMITSLSPDNFRTVDSHKREVALSFIGLSILLFTTYGFNIVRTCSYLTDDLDIPEVCAHRGDNVNAPENTMPAFELAISEYVSWIELDVQQTADGVLVISHDISIERLTGVKKKIYELTYDELEQIEMLDTLPGAYEHVHYATLEEVLRLAKENDVNVEIDIKLNGHEKNMEEEILKTVNKTGMHDNVMVISIYSSAIKKMHLLDPTINTAHAVLQAFESYADVDDATDLSIELSGVNPDLVHAVHEAGMEVSCWTADDPQEIQYMVSCGVDIIGTDDPNMVLHELSKADYRGGFWRIYQVLRHELQHMDQ